MNNYLKSILASNNPEIPKSIEVLLWVAGIILVSVIVFLIIYFCRQKFNSLSGEEKNLIINNENSNNLTDQNSSASDFTNSDFTNDEIAIINAYRKLNPDDKKATIEILNDCNNNELSEKDNKNTTQNK